MSEGRKEREGKRSRRKSRKRQGARVGKVKEGEKEEEEEEEEEVLERGQGRGGRRLSSKKQEGFTIVGTAGHIEVEGEVAGLVVMKDHARAHSDLKRK
eukprot:768785-Hanusia_phi.AAC.2